MRDPRLPSTEWSCSTPLAKKLAASLAQVIDRHEQLFGQLETDIARRVVPGLHPPDAW